MQHLLTKCTLCPRMCGVNRLSGIKGRCGVSGDKVWVARAALHMWEEPCISGENGSGTVFFSGCSLGCVYCQNHTISRAKYGKEMDLNKLSYMFLRLQNEGAHNINLVTPTHYTPQILAALKIAKQQGLHIPAVWNSSGYERRETLEMLKGIVPIFLADYKYSDENLAKRYSDAPDYPDVAIEAIDKMTQMVGTPQFDSDGMMQSGVIVRHLVLPDAINQSKQAIKRLYASFKDDIIISIMSQYTPTQNLPYPELERRITADEYDEVVDFAAFIGIEKGFIQEGESADKSFIPPF